MAAAPKLEHVVSRNVAWSYVNWTVSILVPFVTIPFCVRYLGHQLYGQWLVILNLTSFLGLANLGMGQTVGNRIAEAVANGRRREVGSLVSTAFFAYAVIAILLAFATITLAPWLVRRYAPGASPALVDAFLIYILLIAAAFPFKVHQMALRGFERVDQDCAIEAGASVGRALFVIVFLISGFKLLAVVVINGGSGIVASALAYAQAWRANHQARPRMALFSRPLLRAMVKPSIAFFTLQIGFTLVLGIDNLVIGYALGGAAVTRYAVPFRLMWMGRGMFSVAVAALTPTVTMSYARNRDELLARGFLLSMRVALLYAMAGVLMLWCAGPMLIRLWAGDGVMPDRTTYALQVAFFVLAVWTAAPSMILWATTRHYVWAAVTIFEGLLNLALSLWWVRYWGLAGVIGATLFTSIVTNTWYLPYGALRTLRLSPARLIREIGPGALIAGAAIALVLTLWRDLQFATAPALIGAAFALTAICSTIYAWIVFSRSERAAFTRWLGESFQRAA